MTGIRHYRFPHRGKPWAHGPTKVPDAEMAVVSADCHPDARPEAGRPVAADGHRDAAVQADGLHCAACPDVRVGPAAWTAASDRQDAVPWAYGPHPPAAAASAPVGPDRQRPVAVVPPEPVACRRSVVVSFSFSSFWPCQSV